jgi:hypothetical protein
MNAQKVSNHITAAATYLSHAVGVCGDNEELADDIREVISRLNELDPDPPKGPLTREAMEFTQTVQSNSSKEALLKEIAKIRNEFVECTYREIAAELYARGYHSKSGKAYSGMMIGAIVRGQKKSNA